MISSSVARKALVISRLAANGCEGFSAARRAEDQAIGVFEPLAVHHDEVVGESVQTVVERAGPSLEQLLGRERDKDGGGTGGQRPLGLHQIVGQGQARHEALLLLPVKAGELAVVLLGDTRRLEHVGFQLLRRAPGVYDQKRQQEHPLILALQLFQEVLSVLPVGCQIRRNNVHIVPSTNRLFLFLDGVSIQFRDGALHRLDGLVLVHRVDVHGDDLAGLHAEEVFQKLVAEVGRRDVEEARRAVEAPDLEGPCVEGKGARRDEVLDRKPAFGQGLPVESEF